MKLKVNLTEDAQTTLLKEVLPALLKLSTAAQLVVSQEQVMFVMATDQLGGSPAFVKLAIPIEFMFQPGGEIKSNFEASTMVFDVSLPLLLKIFQVAESIGADTMQMVLGLHESKNDDGTPAVDSKGAVVKEPVLKFHCVGEHKAMSQELEIGRPWLKAKIAELSEMLAQLHALAWYLDVTEHAHKIEALLATLGRKASHVQLVACATGALHAEIATGMVVQGMEIEPLEVCGTPPAELPALPREPTPDARLVARRGLGKTTAPSVEVPTKLLGKALAAFHSMRNLGGLLLSCGSPALQVLHLRAACHWGIGGENEGLNVWIAGRANEYEE